MGMGCHSVETMFGGGALGLPRRTIRCRLLLPADQARRRNERLLRVEVLTGLLVDRDRAEARVPGRVDREAADDAVRDRQTEDALGRRCALTAALGDGREHDVHGLCAIRRVRIRSGADLLAEALDEGRACASESL